MRAQDLNRVKGGGRGVWVIRVSRARCNGVVLYNERGRSKVTPPKKIFGNNLFCYSVNIPSNSGELRYLSPASGRTTTIVLPAISGSFANARCNRGGAAGDPA